MKSSDARGEREEETEVLYHRTGGLRAGRRKRRWRRRKACLIRHIVSLIATLSARASHTVTALKRKLRETQKMTMSREERR